MFNSKAHDLHGMDGVTDGQGWEPAEELVMGKKEFDELGSWKQNKIWECRWRLHIGRRKW